MRTRLMTLAILAICTVLTVSCTNKGMMKKDSMHQDTMMEDQGTMQDDGMMKKQDSMKN